MSQATKIQDEPSMEEILASIRRIIEDSDPGQPQSPAAQPVANDEGARSGSADRMPMRSSAGAEPMPGQGAVPAAGREHRAMPAPSKMRETVAPPVVRTAEAPVPLSVQRPRPEERAAVAPADSPVPSMTSGRSGPATPDPAGPPTSAPQGERPPAIAAESPLISKTTGRHVSAAFEELTAAVEETRRRDFEKMAREMMRPMLQEWLDQNLPSLVERLVRAEIVRITGAAADGTGTA